MDKWEVGEQRESKAGKQAKGKHNSQLAKNVINILIKV
jgi:hypothetical protein